MFAEYHRSPVAQDGKTPILVACICLGDWFFQEVLACENGSIEFRWIQSEGSTEPVIPNQNFWVSDTFRRHSRIEG